MGTLDPATTAAGSARSTTGTTEALINFYGALDKDGLLPNFLFQ